MSLIQFPTERVQIKSVRGDLRTLADALQDSYANLDEVFADLSSLEESIEEVEEIYNQKIIELARLVGAENIEMDDLQFATNISVSASPDGTLIFFIPDEGIETQVNPIQYPLPFGDE